MRATTTPTVATVLCVAATLGLAGALSTPPPPPASPSLPSSDDVVEPRGFIEFTNPIIGEPSSLVGHRLPASFIRDWPTWVLEEDGTLSRIPDGNGEEGGFVTPTSIDELWQPVDLRRPDMRLAVGLHVRSGVVRHVMPALDVSYDGGMHRNRGMCSVPLAYAWADFAGTGGGGVPRWDRYRLRASSKKRGGDDDDDDGEWTELASSSSGGGDISEAVERAVLFLAGEGSPDALGDGSHIIQVVLKGAEAVMVPKSSHVLRVTLVDGNVDDGGGGSEPLGILQVTVSTSMSGSESRYLPEAYKALYGDESLRNPLYVKFQERKKGRP